MSEIIYKVNDKDYPVEIHYKRIRNIHYRLKDGVFHVSCNIFTSKKSIIQGLDRFALKLIEKEETHSPIGCDYIYIFGEKYPLQESGEITLNNDEKIIYKNREDLSKKLKKLLLSYLNKNVGYYSNEMTLPLYKVSVRDMSTRFGSNSKATKSMRFALKLVHFSREIIDSVIVHELAHILVFDHSKRFYDVVYKYCPRYDIYRKKLIRGIYA